MRRAYHRLAFGTAQLSLASRRFRRTRASKNMGQRLRRASSSLADGPSARSLRACDLRRSLRSPAMDDDERARRRLPERPSLAGRLQHHRLPVLAEDVAQRVGDLAQGGASLYGRQDEGHEVLLALRSGAHAVDRSRDRPAVAPPPAPPPPTP